MGVQLRRHTLLAAASVGADRGRRALPADNITHTIGGTGSCLRKALDEGRRNRVCTHVMPGRVEFYEHRHGLRRVLALAAGPGEDDGLDKRPAWDRPPRNEAEKRAGARSALRPCRDEPGSCTICLTDYTTTVERGQQARETWRHDSGQIVYEPAVEGWRVTTTAYHGVGACRDVQDWRWVALVGDNTGPVRDFSAALNHRNPVAFPLGRVREK